MVNDPIGDMLIQVKNAALAHKRTIRMPASKAKLAVAKILKEKGYLSDCDMQKEGEWPVLTLTLAYEDKSPILSGVRRVSKPGLRRYVGKGEIPYVLGGMGIAVLSTPQGVMAGDEARKKGVGGELICEVW
jgi:small subunit ribosomal protein S8